jgi:hypothetical protein
MTLHSSRMIHRKKALQGAETAMLGGLFASAGTGTALLIGMFASAG